MKAPNGQWTIVAFALPLIGGYLLDYFGGYEWAAPAAGACSVAAAILVAWVQAGQPVTQPPGDAEFAAREPSRAQKFWKG